MWTAAMLLSMTVVAAPAPAPVKAWTATRSPLVPGRSVVVWQALSPRLAAAIVAPAGEAVPADQVREALVDGPGADRQHGDLVLVEIGGAAATARRLVADADLEVVDGDRFVVVVNGVVHRLRGDTLASASLVPLPRVPPRGLRRLACAASADVCAWRVADDAAADDAADGVADVDANADANANDANANANADADANANDANDADAVFFADDHATVVVGPGAGAGAPRQLRDYGGAFLVAPSGRAVAFDDTVVDVASGGVRGTLRGRWQRNTAAGWRAARTRAAAVVHDGMDPWSSCVLEPLAFRDDAHLEARFAVHADGVGDYPPCPPRQSHVVVDLRALRNAPVVAAAAADNFDALGCGWSHPRGALQQPCAVDGARGTVPDAIVVGADTLLILRGANPRFAWHRTATFSGDAHDATAVEVRLDGASVVRFDKGGVAVAAVAGLDDVTAVEADFVDGWHLVRTESGVALVQLSR